MMPRFSPPTATGFPRRRESAACSTDAKKASASRWTMTRGTSEAFAFSAQGDHYALDHQFLCGNEVRIFRVLGPKKRFTTVQQEGFQRALVVDERSNHVAVAWRHAMFQDDEIAVHDALSDHRVASDFEGEGARRRFDANGRDVDGNAARGLLLSVVGESGRDGTVNRNVYDPTAKRIQRGDDPQ